MYMPLGVLWFWGHVLSKRFASEALHVDVPNRAVVGELL
jgi:hypothetical protein